MNLKSVKVIVYVVLLFSCTQMFGQNLRPEIKKIVEVISKGEQVEGLRLGIAGSRSILYSRFEKLKENATEKELLSLLEHKSAVVKGYTAWALAEKKYHDLESIFKTFLKTKETVQTQSGCIVSEDLLAGILYSKVLYPSNKVVVTDADKKYYKEQLQKLDHIILRKRGEVFLLSSALKNNQANPENYAIVKTLALEDNNLDALAELAKYQKESDIDLILEKGTDAYKAMSYFPNPKFWNFLIKHKATANSFEYFKAIAAFQNDDAVNTLTSIYKTVRKEKRKGVTNLTKAILELYCPKYKKLSLQIFEETKTINITHLRRLLKIAPEESTPYFVNGLLSDSENNFLEDYFKFETKDSIVPLLLKNIKKYQPKKIPEICIHNVSSAKFMELTTFLDIIIENKIETAKKPLLQRLQKKTYPFETFHLTRTLLSFEDKSLHKEIKETLLASREKWDRGNWSAAFKELFEKYGINI
ncbi:hypothetical protein [Kordia sp.]|uniref:hypothetical protein n=1 Tax=Kordia sp. TaxID=1965332 RepID=UPI003D6B6453